MSKFTEGSWQRAFTAVKEQFELESLLPEQENALREFLEGRNMSVNLPTGYGRSLIFQCLPIAADALLDKPRGSSLVVVISPLRSLMEDQVLFLNNNGVPVIAITDEEDPDIVQQVINGNYIVVEENSQVPQFLPFLLPMHPHRSPMTLLLSLLSRRYFLTRILLVLFG